MSVEIKPSELESVEEIGMLDGESVKMIKTVGGLVLAVGKPRGKNKEEVLSAGSHPAIVRFNVQKSFQTFRPAMMKSSSEPEVEVFNLSALLPENKSSKGYDLYILRKNSEIEFQLTKTQVEVVSYKASLLSENLELQKTEKVVPGDLAFAVDAIAKAAAIVAIEEDKRFIKINNKKIDPKKII